MKTEQKLKRAIQANAVFSFLSGATLIFLHRNVAEILSISNSNILIYIGIGLWLFVVSLLYTALQTKLVRSSVRSIIYQDWAWVIASIALILINPFGISSTGNILIGVVAVLVGILAYLQAYFLKRL